MKRLYIFVTVFVNSNSLLQASAISIGSDEYFDDLLKQALDVTSVDEYTTIKIDFQTGKSDRWHSVIDGIEESLEICLQLNATHVRFICSSNSENEYREIDLSNQESALDRLMKENQQVKLPIVKNTNNRKDLLFNDFIEMLQKRNLGWVNNNHLTIGKDFAERVTSLIWYIDPHLQKFKQRSIELPLILKDLPQYKAKSQYNTYYETGHHKKTDISRDQLEKYCKALELSLKQLWVSQPQWENIIKNMFDLVLMVKQYASYLQDAAQRMRIIHNSNFPVRNGHDDITVEDFEATLCYPSNYEPLASLLRNSEYYQWFNIDELLPTKAQNRYIYFQNIATDSCFTLYRYYHGNYLGTLNFVWKLPSIVPAFKIKKKRLKIYQNYMLKYQCIAHDKCVKM